MSPDKESIPDNNSFTLVTSSVLDAAIPLLIRSGLVSPVYPSNCAIAGINACFTASLEKSTGSSIPTPKAPATILAYCSLFLLLSAVGAYLLIKSLTVDIPLSL